MQTNIERSGVNPEALKKFSQCCEIVVNVPGTVIHFLVTALNKILERIDKSLSVKCWNAPFENNQMTLYLLKTGQKWTISIKCCGREIFSKQLERYWNWELPIILEDCFEDDRDHICNPVKCGPDCFYSNRDYKRLYAGYEGEIRFYYEDGTNELFVQNNDYFYR